MQWLSRDVCGGSPACRKWHWSCHHSLHTIEASKRAFSALSFYIALCCAVVDIGVIPATHRENQNGTFCKTHTPFLWYFMSEMGILFPGCLQFATILLFFHFPVRLSLAVSTQSTTSCLLQGTGCDNKKRKKKCEDCDPDRKPRQGNDKLECLKKRGRVGKYISQTAYSSSYTTNMIRTDDY